MFFMIPLLSRTTVDPNSQPTNLANSVTVKVICRSFGVQS